MLPLIFYKEFQTNNIFGGLQINYRHKLTGETEVGLGGRLAGKLGGRLAGEPGDRLCDEPGLCKVGQGPETGLGVGLCLEFNPRLCLGSGGRKNKWGQEDRW